MSFILNGDLSKTTICYYLGADKKRSESDFRVQHIDQPIKCKKFLYKTLQNNSFKNLERYFVWHVF